MRQIILIVLLLITPSVGRADGLPGGYRIWVTQSTRWEKAPADYNPLLSSAYATVLYFGEGGKFEMIDCLLYKQDGKLSISNGDGLNIYMGEWSEKDGKLSVSYRLVERTVARIGEALPGPVHTANISYDPRSKSITLDGKSYRSSRGLDEKEVASHLGYNLPR